MSVKADPTPEALFEIACARAGNVLFCPLAAQPARASGNLPEFYEDGAHLLRLLVAARLRSRHADYHSAITEIAVALKAAMENHTSHMQCADYVLYRLEGMPDARADSRRLARLKAMIGTFYGNLLVARAVTR